MTRPRIIVGALVGFLAAAPLTALLFLAWRALATPFTPFDLFDRMARVLPGPLVTFGIDAMVTVLRWVAPGSVAELAKPAEQGLAVAIFVVLLTLVGAAVFAHRAPSAPLGAAHGAHGRRPRGPRRRRPRLVGRRLPRAQAGGCRLAAPGLPRLGRRGGLELAPSRRTRAGLGAGCGGDPARPASVPRTARQRHGRAHGDGCRRRRPDRPGRRGDPDAAAAGGASRPWSATHRLPNAGADLEPAPGTRPELTPLDDHYRIDINTIAPDIDGDTWRLRVHGLVDAPQTYTLEDLRSFPALDQFVTLACISNRVAGDLISTQRWTGVSLQDLLPAWGLAPQASHLLLRAADGFFETVALDEVRRDARVMLAYAWDGLPLRREHGFPLRIYIPDRYGMKQPKWIESIEVLDHWVPGYWVERGWSREAIMNATSVIDTVATENLVERDGQTLVPIGGIAHAGVRGVSRVEVQVDDGPWQEARLRQPLSSQTWTIWRFDWPFAEGEHTFAVRCTDGDGAMQVVEPSSVRPDGATGVHRVRRQVSSG